MTASFGLMGPVWVYIGGAGDIENETTESDDGIGEGPTHDAVINHAVRTLIENLSENSLSGAEIIKRTGDHPVTVYRQLRVLATNSAECPPRLRGWVRS